MFLGFAKFLYIHYLERVYYQNVPFKPLINQRIMNNCYYVKSSKEICMSDESSNFFEETQLFVMYRLIASNISVYCGIFLFCTNMGKW